MKNDKWRKYWNKRAKKSPNKECAAGRKINTEWFNTTLDFINTKLNFYKTDVVIDAGCGTGLISSHIANKVSWVICLDFAIEMLKQADKKENISYIVGDIKEIPLKSEIFDKCFCYNVFQYLGFAETKKVAAELNRICKRRAKILVGDIPNSKRKGLFIVKNIVKISTLTRIKEGLLRINDIFHTKKSLNNISTYWYNPEQLAELISLSGIGCKVVEINTPPTYYRFDLLIEKK